MVAGQKASEQETVLKRWDGNTITLECIGHGLTGLVFALDHARVVKVDWGTDGSKQDLETERKAYVLLGRAAKPSLHILKCSDAGHLRGIVLERCPETVRHRLKTMPKRSFLADSNIELWTKQAAEGLAFLHENEILHSDVSCGNMLLDSRDVLKLCDFAGSSVQGSTARTGYESGSRPPFISQPTHKSDLFALGSAAYEMLTKKMPYSEKSMPEVEKLYQRGRFPPVKKTRAISVVIKKCWKQKYSSALEVVREIDIPCCDAPDGLIDDSSTTSASSSTPVSLSKTSTRSSKTQAQQSNSQKLSKAPFNNRLSKFSRKTADHSDCGQSLTTIELSGPSNERNVKNPDTRKTKTRYRPRFSQWFNKSEAAAP